MTAPLLHVRSCALLGSALVIVAGIVAGLTMKPHATPAPTLSAQPPAVCPKSHGGQQHAGVKVALDCSGRPRLGVASFYADRFAGRIMADGTPMRLSADNAASRTLPLGTIAIVTNLRTGMSARVTIRDRGPYVGGRLIDLSPHVARRIGLSRAEGLAPVRVTPLNPALARDSASRGPDTPPPAAAEAHPRHT